MKALKILPCLLCFCSSPSYSQDNTNIDSMYLATYKLLQSLGITKKYNDFINHKADSLFTAMILNIPPQFNSRMISITKEEWDKFFDKLVTPNGLLISKLASVYSKYFTYNEILLIAEYFETNIPTSKNSGAVIKYYSIEYIIKSDSKKVLTDLQTEMVSKLNKKILNRWLDEGLIDEDEFRTLKDRL